VTVGRRAYRSSDNEYLINDSKVRLRDVVNLLAEGGLGQRTYSVIGQGLVDAALSQQAWERRALFEEAAGIAVYRSQRERSAQQLDETKRNLERVHDILSEIRPRLRRLEGQVERCREYERVSAYLARLQRTWYGYHWGRAQRDLNTAQGREAALQRNLASRLAQTEGIDAQLSQLRSQQTELRASLRDAYRETADLHDQMDSAQRELATLAERARNLTAQREELLQELEPLFAQQNAQEERVQAARAAADQLRASVDEQEQRVTALDAELQSLRNRLAQQSVRSTQARKELEDLGQRQEEIEASLTQSRATQARLEAERNLLARLREEGTTLSQGARALREAELDGVIGLLGALIRVPEEWELAVEAALGPRAQALVIDDWNSVSEARLILGPDERAMLLPLGGIPRSAPRIQEMPPGARPATSIIDCDRGLQPVLEAVLGGTLLVDDLEAAETCLPALPQGGMCATRSGELLTADGTVTIGAASLGMLAQERAWRQLPQQLEQLALEQRQLEAESRAISDTMANTRHALQELEREQTAASQAVTQAEGGPLSEARTALAVTRQALESQHPLLQRELTALERIKAQLSSRQSQTDELASRRTAVETQLEELQQQVTRLGHQLGQIRSRIGPSEDRLMELTQAQEQQEEQQRQARGVLRQMEDRVSTARLETVRCQDRLERLQERMQEELGLLELEVADQITAQPPLPLRPVVSQLPTVETLPDGLQEEIRSLKTRLRRIGPVNPNAPNEFAETQERHEFLTTQVADLEEASKRLRGVIAELDELMEQAFSDVFGQVAVEFEKAFTRLFDGGSARLELTEPEDLMSTGVDIVAQPPGKRLSGLALLSGGERALTAAALIFAIIRVSPTPFCVLDEVDAMLDEANVGRFRAMLQELSQDTQFIIITHNRHTVEAAETVYGVSMGSEGVSRVVSLQLEEQETA
jgi:chromosome segregation protein